MEANYKNTPIGKIPEDWEVVRLGDKKVSELIKSGSTPSKKKAEYWNGEIPFVTIGDMTKTGKYLFDTYDKITELALKKTNTFLVPENSILLSMYGTIGKVVINKAQVAISQNIAGIIPNRDYTNEEFLYYVIQQFSFQFSSAKIITLKHLDIKMVKNMLIPLPPLEEQRKIAEILSTVDKAIEKVDKAIAKTERLKKGLMQELLTKGIGHKEFKDTEIGRIPKEWRVVRLGEITKKIKRGPSKKTNSSGKGIVYLTSDYITDDGFIRFENLKYLDEHLIDDLNRYLLQPGDLIINCVNSLEKIGKVAVFEGFDQKVMIGFNNFALTLKDMANSYFVKFLFLYDRFRNMLRGISKPAVQQVSFSSTDLIKIKIPLPPLSEQQKIAEILSTIDKKLELQRKRKEKLERIKKGLMNDLLTGRRRVKI